MYFSNEELILTLILKRNKFGKYFYHTDIDGINWYLFGSNQLWYGISRATKKGELMISSTDDKKLVKFGKWYKQKDNSIFVSISINGTKHGLVGKFKAKSIEFFWADSKSEILKLGITNNPNITN